MLVLVLFGQYVQKRARWSHQNPCKKLIHKNSLKPLEKWHGCDMVLAAFFFWYLVCVANVCCHTFLSLISGGRAICARAISNCMYFWIIGASENQSAGDSVWNFLWMPLEKKKKNSNRIRIGNQENGVREWASEQVLKMFQGRFCFIVAWWGSPKKTGQYMVTKYRANNQKLANKHYGCNSRLCQNVQNLKK